MGPKNAAEGPARVVSNEMVEVLGKNVSVFASANYLAFVLNDVLAPMVAKAAMAERMAEVLKHIISQGKVDEGEGIWLGHSGQLMAEDVLTKYAALGGKSE